MSSASPVIRLTEMIRVTKIFLAPQNVIAINYRMLFTSKLYLYFIANLFEARFKVRYTQLELINSSNSINLHKSHRYEKRHLPEHDDNAPAFLRKQLVSHCINQPQ